MTAFVLCLAFAAIAYLSFLWDRDKRAWDKERKELVRRIAEPQAVVVENAPKREKPPHIPMNDDAAYKRLMEARGQIPWGTN